LILLSRSRTSFVLPGSISSTFYVCVFHTNVIFETFFTYIRRKKLLKWCSYKKRARLMWMKLTLGVNFINILLGHFSYEHLSSAWNLALNELSYVKYGQKTLMKLTTGWPAISTVRECVAHLDRRSEMIVFKSILTFFEWSLIFRGKLGQYRKSFWAQNQKTNSKFSFSKSVKWLKGSLELHLKKYA